MKSHLTPEQRKQRDNAANAILEPTILHTLRKEQLWKLIKALSDERKIRYSRRRKRKYGNINKGFTQEELDQFLKTCTHQKARLMFITMANLGLRIGEVARIKVQDLDFAHRRLYLRTEKAGTHDSLLLHDGIYTALKTWVDAQNQSIRAHEDYVFFAGNGKNPHAYASPNWLRGEFRRVCKDSGLDAAYAESDERQGRESRTLHRLTTHSLRHYFITNVYHRTKDPIVTQRLARHTDSKSTQVYIFTSQHDMDLAITSAFGKEASHDPPVAEAPGMAATPRVIEFRLNWGEEDRVHVHIVHPARTESIIDELQIIMPELTREGIVQHLVNYALLADWYVTATRVAETPDGQETYAFMMEVVQRLVARGDATATWQRWGLGRMGQVEVLK